MPRDFRKCLISSIACDIYIKSQIFWLVMNFIQFSEWYRIKCITWLLSSRTVKTVGQLFCVPSSFEAVRLDSGRRMTASSGGCYFPDSTQLKSLLEVSRPKKLIFPSLVKVRRYSTSNYFRLDTIQKQAQGWTERWTKKWLDPLRIPDTLNVKISQIWWNGVLVC